MEENEEIAGIESNSQEMVIDSLIDNALNLLLRRDNARNRILADKFCSYIDFGEGFVVELDEDFSMFMEEKKFIIYVEGDDFMVIPIPLDAKDDEGNSFDPPAGTIIPLHFTGEGYEEDENEE